MFGFPLLHAFAAGTALSSTSLGTVLAHIGVSGPDLDLQKTKCGTALLGAAVADDVVAFVLSEIGSLLGEHDSGNSSTLGAHIGRTIGVLFSLEIVAITRFGIRPTYMRPTRSSYRVKAGRSGLLTIMAVVFIGDDGGRAICRNVTFIWRLRRRARHLVPRPVEEDDHLVQATCTRRAGEEGQVSRRESSRASTCLLKAVCDVRRVSRHHSPWVDCLLAMHSAIHCPLPFYHRPQPSSPRSRAMSPRSSSTYSSPSSSAPSDIPLWPGKVIWKGLIYTLFMLLGKALTGGWILFWPIEGKRKATWKETLRARLPAALLLSFAMIARGEIGLLVSQIAYTTPEQQLDEDGFLITTWAIVLCTVIGPVGVGYIIKRFQLRVVQGGWQ